MAPPEIPLAPSSQHLSYGGGDFTLTESFHYSSRPNGRDYNRVQKVKFPLNIPPQLANYGSADLDQLQKRRGMEETSGYPPKMVPVWIHT